MGAVGQVLKRGGSSRAQRVTRPLIIIPTYNERQNLPPLLEAIWEVLPETQVLVVDDNSPDGTGLLAAAQATHEPRLSVLQRPGKRGVGRAYLAGFEWALAGDWTHILQMDADFSHQPKYLRELLAATEGADLALGARYVPGGGVEGWGALRQLISRGGNLLARRLLRLPVQDLTGGFKCFRREVLEALDLSAVRSTGYVFQVELSYLAYQAGFRLAQVPIIFPERCAGESKMSGAIVCEAVLNLLRLRLEAR